MHSKCSAIGLVHIKDVRTCITSASGRDSSVVHIIEGQNQKLYQRTSILHNSGEASSNEYVGGFLLALPRLPNLYFVLFHNSLGVSTRFPFSESYDQLLKTR